MEKIITSRRFTLVSWGLTLIVVLSAAGHSVKVAHRETVAGLTERELDVLRLLSRGLTIKQMAAQLVISEKTVDSHIQHIYNKIGVSTRAGATLFAIEHNLVV